MADVDYEVATKFTGEDELRRGATAFDELGQHAERALDDVERKSKGSGLGLLNLEAGINIATQAFDAFQNVASGAMAALSEGAALADARGDFADLSAEIGTTADALENKLSSATAGLVTNAQLISDASGLMALNLGLTEDEIVRFSGAAAELDWNMEALADTLNTGATRGLKEMGLNISDVKGRMAELEAQGIATDKAFRMAILEAAEEKIGRVGKKSEETAGQLVILQNKITGASDAFKLAFAESTVSQISDAAGSVELLGDQLVYAAEGAGKLAGFLAGGVFEGIAKIGAQSQLDQVAEQYAALGGDINDLGDDFVRLYGIVQSTPLIASYEDTTTVLDQLTAAYEDLRLEQQRMGGVREYVPLGDYNLPDRTRELRDFSSELTKFRQLEAESMNRPLPSPLDGGNWSYVPEIMGQVNQALVDQSTYAAQTRDAWEAYTDAITARGGDIFADFIDEASRAREAGDQFAFDLNRAIFDAANQEGAGADFLSGFAENIGAAGEDIAAALQAAQEQALVTDLAAGVREAGIAWSEFPGIVEEAIAELEGKTDRIARAMPSVEDRGFRENFQQELEQVTPEPIEVPLEVQLREDLIDAAISNARGMVEGFVNPEQAYQAVMDMDITAVETGVGRATELIEGVPTSKTVTINWQQTGTDVIAALRALGVIP